MNTLLGAMTDTHLLRILFSVFLGLLIGLERQLTGHFGGIKTNTLICFGACLFSTFAFVVDGEDKTRIAAQVVSGVGFICSGVIFKDKAKESVSGLSTSATIWTSAAIGVMASSGQYLLSFISTIILILCNLLITKLSKIKALDFFDDTDKIYEINIICSSSLRKEIKETIMETISKSELTLTSLESESECEGKISIKALFLHSGKRCDSVVESLITKILLSEEVYSAGWEIV